MSNVLTKADALLIQYFFEDDMIKSSLIDKKQKEVYKRIDIEENGDIILGKTSCKMWNHFIGCEKVISFNDFAIRVANVISGQKNNKNNTTFMGLIEVIAKEGVKNENYSTVIDQLLIAIKFGTNGPLRCKIPFYNKVNGDPEKPRIIGNNTNRVVIEADDVDKHFRLNPFETLGIKIKAKLDIEPNE